MKRCPPLLVKAFLFFALNLFAITALANQSPDPQKRRQQAPEHIRIKVLSIRKDADKTGTTRTMLIWVKAKVEDVYQSESKLKVGDVVTIVYESVDEKASSDSLKAKNSDETLLAIVEAVYPPILEKDKSYPAFLKKQDSDFFVPVAEDYSFTDAPEGR